MQREYQDQCESTPDPFIRYTYPKLLDESRAAVAKVINAPVDGVVFVPNATTGVNTVLRNIVWNEGDEILYFKYEFIDPLVLSALLLLLELLHLGLKVTITEIISMLEQLWKPSRILKLSPLIQSLYSLFSFYLSKYQISPLI